MAINKQDIIELLVEARVNLPDEKAVKFTAMYPHWKAGLTVEVGQRYQHEGVLYKVRQNHTTMEGQEPGIRTAALYEAINEVNAGTLEDPIPYETTMTVYKDKYYTYGGVIYLCIRDSGQPLYAEPASLVGNYFEVV